MNWPQIAAKLGAHRVFRLLSFYPPFVGAGIRVRSLDARVRIAEVEMKLTPWNRNYFGTHFGGSLYSMADPFYALMLAHNLGREYVVWDKSATIEFKRPGRTRVHARFEVSDAEIAAIIAEVAVSGRAHPHFSVEILDTDNELVARVTKVLSVRRK